ncbi:MAG: sodium/proline symporter [Gemmatimonadetes bacterium]|nr:sodium/proline symporter [Gemmatimonadota bacterium]
MTRPEVVGVMLAYLAVVLGIGAWATRRTKTAGDFFLAGRSLGLFPMAMAAMSATLSGFAFIGGPGLVYSVGLGAVFIVLPLSITNSLSAWVLARPLQSLAAQRSMLTVPDAIGARFASPAAQGLAAISIVVACAGYVATNLLALGLVLDAVFGWGLPASILIGALVTVAYSVGGGILAGVYTDVFQGTVMALASAAVTVQVLRVGGGVTGIANDLMQADPALLSPFGRLSPVAALSWFLVFGIGALGQPHVINKFYMLRDPARLRWYPAVMNAVMAVTLLLFVGVGLVVRALVHRGALAPLARPDDATSTFLLGYAPAALAGLVFAGVAAAIMSSVNAFLNVGAAAVTHDIPAWVGRRWGNPLTAGRAATLCLAVVATAIALRSTTLVAFLGIFGWGLFASTLVPSVAIGLNWPGATRQGAIASIVTGFVVTVGVESLAWAKVIAMPAGVSGTALGLVGSIGAFLIASWMTGRGADQVAADEPA